MLKKSKKRHWLLWGLALFFVLSIGRVIYALSWHSYTPNRFPEPERTNQIMIRAVAADDLQAAEQYLAAGANPNTVMLYLDEPMDSQGWSPQALWIRFRGGPGAPVIRAGPPALMQAVRTGDPRMVTLLIRHGADVNTRAWYDNTALELAKERKNAAIVSILKGAGAKR